MKRATGLGLTGMSITLALFGFSCSKSIAQNATDAVVQQAVNQASGGKASVNLDNNNVIYKDQNGTVQYGDSVTLPADFPKEIPIYAGTKVFSTAQSNGDTYLTLQSTDKIADVLAWYKSQLEGAGWTSTDSFDSQGTSARIYEKNGDKMTLTLSTPSDNSTMIAIGLEPATATK